MQAQGFSREVKGKDGKTLQLPTGQYRFESKTLTLYEVLGLAMTGARSIGKKFAAVTTQGSSAWVGLEEVRKWLNGPKSLYDLRNLVRDGDKRVDGRKHASP